MSKIIENEFLVLTNFGNELGIRHHERVQVILEKNDSYDYLFNRCLSLMLFIVKNIDKTKILNN